MSSGLKNAPVVADRTCVYAWTANDGSTYQVPGGIGDIAFPKNHADSVACGSLVQIDSGAYKESVPLTCFKNVPLSVLGS